ncbi:MAG: hypothetical protein QOJ32_3416 [Frankiaceae bacterium]|nr:hypothetical protein [Frankiaceae bacterium]MDQ1673652.1 hypothetical protein [Frankiaceae bacterium]
MNVVSAPPLSGRLRQVAVVGPRDADVGLERIALELGAGLAQLGLVVVTGGLGGVMAAACRGAVEAGGTTLGLLPGEDVDAANPWVTTVVPTGLGEARDVLVVRAAAVVVAVGGGWGTLAEVALALRSRIPVLGIDSWELHPPPGSDDGTRILPVADAEAALDLLRAAFAQ